MPTDLHIGFDISQTGAKKAGCGFYAHAMIEALLELEPDFEYSLFPSFGDFYFDPEMPAECSYRAKNLRYGPMHRSREEARNFWRQADIEDLLGAPDIIHANNFWSPIQFRSSRVIYTLHDIGFALNPEWSTETNRLGCFDGLFRSAIAADWVVAVSNASRAHYLSMFPHFAESRIRVIHPCSRFAHSNIEARPPRAVEHLTPGRFWLNVGTIEPRKNQHFLCEAFARYLASGASGMPLVLAGGSGWLMDDFQHHLAALGLTERVVLTGYVSDEELVWLYKNCFANLYPSLFEGFGLPVLEGMQFGAPTIASQSSSIPEVAGDGAILLDPHDCEAWADAMRRVEVESEFRANLTRAALDQASRFDWQANARALLELYFEAVAAPKRSQLS